MMGPAHINFPEELMTSTMRSDLPSGPGPNPTEAELSELARLRERFRSHHIFRDATSDRGIRYTAYGATIRARPHTIVTNDLTELRNELEESPRWLALRVSIHATCAE